MIYVINTNDFTIEKLTEDIIKHDSALLEEAFEKCDSFKKIKDVMEDLEDNDIGHISINAYGYHVVKAIINSLERNKNVIHECYNFEEDGIINIQVLINKSLKVS